MYNRLLRADLRLLHACMSQRHIGTAFNVKLGCLSLASYPGPLARPDRSLDFIHARILFRCPFNSCARHCRLEILNTSVPNACTHYADFEVIYARRRVPGQRACSWVRGHPFGLCVWVSNQRYTGLGVWETILNRRYTGLGGRASEWVGYSHRNYF